MDEARVQQYVALIQQLLECPSGQEGAILQANGALVDEGFVQVAMAVAQQAAQQGDNNVAQFLQQLVGQIAAQLGLGGVDAAKGQPREQGAVLLLQELSQTEMQRLQIQGSPQLIFAVLQRHLAHLNLEFIPVMQQVVRGFAADNPQEAEAIVGLIENKLLVI